MVGELRGRWSGDDGKRAVVAGDADARDGHPLPRRNIMQGGRGDGYEKTVFGGAGGAGGNRDTGGLCKAVSGRGGTHCYGFIRDARSGGGDPLVRQISTMDTRIR